MRDWILHLDLDQFIAAVELQRHPNSAADPSSSVAMATPPAHAP